MESLNSNSQERELHQLQQMQDKSKESCMASFRLLHSLLQVLSNNDLKRLGSEGGFERAFASLFDQDVQTFRDSMLLNLGQLQKQLDKEKFQEDRSMAAFWVIKKQFLMFIDSQFTWDYDSQMIEKYFAEYTRIEYDSSINERQMQSKEGKVDSSKALDASLVVIKCSAIESENSNSEHAFNKSVNESSGTESRKKDTSSSLGNYITHVVDTDIRPANDQVPFAEINELKAQLQAKNSTINNLNKQTKNVYEKSNEAKVKQEIDVLETITIELESGVAILLAENENKTVENADLKAQIQEKVFTNATLKNELRKLKGNNVNTKFAKPSILGKPDLQPLRNQSVVRQSTAF
ncbi:hypothetical protein Tco_0486618 [Tanacetum coccineum]